MRRLAALIAFIVVAAPTSGCGGSASRQDLPQASSAPGSNSPASFPAQNRGTADASTRPTPEPVWQRLEQGGAPEDWLDRADVPLPASYWPYRGTDGFGQPNPERIQRQLAVYLLRLRAANRKQADRLNIDLWPIPAAWCSVVLPTRTSTDFDAQIARADGDGRRMAPLLRTRFQPPASTSTLRFLRYARTRAAIEFCPIQAQTPGRPAADSVSAAAQIPSHTPLLDAPIPVYYDPNEGISHDAMYRTYERDYAALVYAQKLAQHLTPVRSTAILDCDTAKSLAREDTVAETARNTLHLLELGDYSAKEEATEKRSTATDAANRSFDLQEQLLRCR